MAKSELLSNLDFTSSLMRVLIQTINDHGASAGVVLPKLVSEPEHFGKMVRELLGDLWTKLVGVPFPVENIDWECKPRELYERFVTYGRVDAALLDPYPMDYFGESPKPTGPCKYMLCHMGGVDPMFLPGDHAGYRELIAFAMQHLREVRTAVPYRVVALGGKTDPAPKVLVYRDSSLEFSWLGEKYFDTDTFYLVRVYD